MQLVDLISVSFSRKLCTHTHTPIVSCIIPSVKIFKEPKERKQQHQPQQQQRSENLHCFDFEKKKTKNMHSLYIDSTEPLAQKRDET